MVGCTAGMCCRERQEVVGGRSVAGAVAMNMKESTLEQRRKKLGDGCGRSRPMMLLVGVDAKYSLYYILEGKAQVGALL